MSFTNGFWSVASSREHVNCVHAFRQTVFKLLATDPRSKARRGRLLTAHGSIETPVFMPVGTQGSVKTLHPDELRLLDAEIILGNTYHLWLRPGEQGERDPGDERGVPTSQRETAADERQEQRPQPQQRHAVGAPEKVGP